jgi:hypothetical protein
MSAANPADFSFPPDLSAENPPLNTYKGVAEGQMLMEILVF